VKRFPQLRQKAWGWRKALGSQFFAGIVRVKSFASKKIENM